MNLFNIRRAFQQKKEKGYDKLYWAIDLHDVIIEGKYNKFNEGREFFPDALRVLKWLKNRADMRWILFSCSHDDAVENICSWLTDHGIAPYYFNANPDFTTSELCNFTKKFYFSILLEDKAGFEGATDWTLIIEELKSIGEWEEPVI